MQDDDLLVQSHEQCVFGSAGSGRVRVLEACADFAPRRVCFRIFPLKVETMRNMDDRVVALRDYAPMPAQSRG
jgi:hypothetical protein